MLYYVIEIWNMQENMGGISWREKEFVYIYGMYMVFHVHKWSLAEKGADVD